MTKLELKNKILTVSDSLTEIYLGYRFKYKGETVICVNNHDLVCVRLIQKEVTCYIPEYKFLKLDIREILGKLSSIRFDLPGQLIIGDAHEHNCRS